MSEIKMIENEEMNYAKFKVGQIIEMLERTNWTLVGDTF